MTPGIFDVLPPEAVGAVYTAGAVAGVGVLWWLKRRVTSAIGGLLAPKALDGLSPRDMLRRATMRTMVGGTVASVGAAQLLESWWWCPLIGGGVIFLSGVLGCIKRGT